MRGRLEEIIIAALRELNVRPLPPPPYLGDMPLYGSAGVLDSAGLVSLVIAVEQAIQDEFGATISLADERALSQTSSPYRTVGSLAEYAANLISTQQVS